MKSLAFLLLFASTYCCAQQYTRGIGIYPGDPREYKGPSLVVDAKTYRNLALHRPAYQSSAYDYNLTAQLITDGVTQRAEPSWLVTATSDTPTLPKQQREIFLDGNPVSQIVLKGENPWVEFDLEGGGQTPELARPVPALTNLDLYLRRILKPAPAGGWAYIVSGSDDGAEWREVGRASGDAFPAMPQDPNSDSFMQEIHFRAEEHFRRYRVQLMAAGFTDWAVADIRLWDQGRAVRISGPRNIPSGDYDSAWMSAGSGEEWIYVDLGARCVFDRVKLAWIRPAAEGALQVSDDAVNWTTLQALSSAHDMKLAAPAHGRYVRVLMTKPAEPGARYILSELEIYGRGGPLPVAHASSFPMLDNPKGLVHPQPAPPSYLKEENLAQGLHLSGGNWRVQRASLVPATGEQISTPGYQGKDWMIATVPGTVLTSYLNDGAIPNPDFGDNQYAISDSFFCADFWYRNEFFALGPQPGQHEWLDFDGVNWKAEVYLNGHSVGRIDGGYMRGHFDVTALLNPAGKNALAVRVIANANPGSTKDKADRTVNGGALGRDNPTYHASIGWDWISTIRGRNTGIWADVTLRTTEAVTVEDPLVTTTLPLPDTTHADVTVQARLRNLESRPVSGVLRASFGSVTVETPVTLDAASTKTIAFTPATQPALHLANPRLWWPVGYGDPHLYPVKIAFLVSGRSSDSKSFQAGIRQFTYSEDGGVLKMWINGRRFIAKGGNWGFPESMLRYRAREYETAMRYHRDEHFNMVRNWVGQTGDEAFYDAADRNGIVIWQDFWLANPWDGPNPDDNQLFLANARDSLLRIRNHASLGLFCGRNEGFPPQPIDDGLRNLVATLEPGSHYIASSADGPVSGHGPYRVEPLRYYFEHAPEKFHSEMGSPNVVGMDSLNRTMPASAQWPQGYQWPLHDYHGHNPFTTAIDHDYGGAGNLAEWDSLAQFVDYDAYRGMYEGQSKNRLGLLIWMSHPAWPSLLWQTYDYFFDTDAGYYGAKKGAEPLHIQWNAATNAVEVVNDSAGFQPGLSARAEVLNLDGSEQWQRTANLDSSEDSTHAAMTLDFPPGLSRTHFIRLTLYRGATVLSRNFYLHGVAEQDYAGIRTLPPAKVQVRSSVQQRGSKWFITSELQNVSATPALLVRVKAVRARSGDPILPALYDDNYIALMPGEARTIEIELEDADTRGERPRVRVEGYNLEAK